MGLYDQWLKESNDEPKVTINMKRFLLERLEDETGVSGAGIVAEGVQFSNGTCVLVWLTEIRSIAAIYSSIDNVRQIHGHNGKTVIKWIDEDSKVL